MAVPGCQNITPWTCQYWIRVLSSFCCLQTNVAYNNNNNNNPICKAPECQKTSVALNSYQAKSVHYYAAVPHCPVLQFQRPYCAFMHLYISIKPDIVSVKVMSYD